MYLSLKSQLLVLTSLGWPAVYAGSGATVHACVTLTTDPPGGKPYKVDFTAGLSTDQCMNNRGENAWVMVSKKGTTCASLGYVELKNSSSDGDLCHTWKSYWGTSYKIDATGQEVTTNSRWQQGGYIELISQSPGTFVCGSANPCSATSQSWSGTGELWIIFKPGTPGIAEIVDTMPDDVTLLVDQKVGM